MVFLPVRLGRLTRAAVKKRVLHIITGLGTGGAERSLVNLLTGPLAGRFDARVISPDDEGDFGPLLIAAGVEVDALRLRGSGTSPMRALRTLRKIVRSYEPDLIQGWMYHGSLAASLAARFGRTALPIAWNIRQSLYDIRTERRGTQWVIRLLARISARPAAIIYNSHQSRLHHESFGFASTNGVVVPNGFDPGRWYPDTRRRDALRAQLNLDGDAVLLGFVGRHHPQKDIPTFLAACAKAMATDDRLHVAMVGEGLTPDNSALSRDFGRLAPERVHALGRRDDVEAILPGFDIFCLSSSSEAFPNVLGEAMACGLPCVATDVGDCARLLDGLGRIVPPGDSDAMAAAIVELARMDVAQRAEMGKAARARIVTSYGLDAAVDRYAELYHSILKREN